MNTTKFAMVCVCVALGVVFVIDRVDGLVSESQRGVRLPRFQVVVVYGTEKVLWIMWMGNWEEGEEDVRWSTSGVYKKQYICVYEMCTFEHTGWFCSCSTVNLSIQAYWCVSGKKLSIISRVTLPRYRKNKHWCSFQFEANNYIYVFQ